MYIWINKAIGIAFVGAGLAACTGLGLPNLGPRSITVLDRAITIAPPENYCPAPKASTETNDTAVVLMGRCLAGSNAPAAIITASIGAAGSADVLGEGPVTLTRFFTSDSGRAMLASSGKAKDVEVMDIEHDAATVMLLIKDRELGTYWRGIFEIRGRLVMLSATGIDSIRLPEASSRALLSRAIAALRGANGAKI